MNKFYNTFKLRLTLFCVLALTVIITSVHITVYVMTKNMIADQIGLGAQSTAVAVSCNIMDDIDSYKEFMETRDVNSAYYRKMQEYFNEIKEASNIKFIYTERPLDSETVEFLLDAEPIGSEYYSAPGDSVPMDSASRKVYDSRIPAKLPETESAFGTLLGGCAPIFDTNGDVLGLVGVNLDVSELFSLLNKLQIVMLCIYLFILVLSLTLIKRYSGIILEPIVKDKLTGAYSKRYYDKIIRNELRISARSKTDLALLMLDLDHFKNINDTYGHDFGDKVLEAVSKTIMSCLRSDDYFIRYGGEEFVVVIPNVNMDAVLEIAERIRTSVEATEIYNEEAGLSIRMTISIGITRTCAQHYPENLLLEEADKALYKAKETRNAVSMFSDNKNESSSS